MKNRNMISDKKTFKAPRILKKKTGNSKMIQMDKQQ